MTISAKVIAHSIGPDLTEVITFELEYPRFIHAELMTHRVFSRNAASSRAIPVKRSIELIQENTAMPIHWGKNQPGMSAKEECNELVGADVFGATREEAWLYARDRAIAMAKDFDRAGYHKQIVNRLLEPFSHIKVVVTATEWNNWFALRNHPDAMPEINELARQMNMSRQSSIPVELEPGSWHVPYYKNGFWECPPRDVDCGNGELLDALAVSASCCAQVSYRRLDDTIEKARDIYQRLVSTKPVHASPFEHQATPINRNDDHWRSTPGITHQDRNGVLWSGNFRGWIQNRQLIPQHVVPG